MNRAVQLRTTRSREVRKDFVNVSFIYVFVRVALASFQ